MAGCFDFRHKASSDYQDIMSGGTFSRLGKKMMRSRSDPDISPSKKTATNANKVSSKSSPAALQGGQAPRRRFVRVVRGSSNDEDLCNPHVKRKSSDTSPPKKIDFEALNRRYFSDSDSDSDSQHKRDMVNLRARSEERAGSPVVSSHEQLRKGLSLDVEIPKRTHFNEQVDVIGIDKKGKQVYTAMEKIQFDNFETCDIRYNQDVCPVSEFDVLESISETPELAKSPPRLLEGMEKVNIELEKQKVEDRAIVKMHMVSGHSIDIDDDKENQDEKRSSEMSSDVNTGANPECSSQLDRDTQSESDCRPRASSMDQKRKAFRMFGRLLRSTSDTLTKLGSPKGSPRNSPNQMRKQHKYIRILRDSDHGDEYYNPHVTRRSSASRLSRSVNNISIEDQLVLRPILRKHQSLDIPDKHTHFQENVEVVEFDKKQKCVELASAQHVQMDQLKSDSETDSVDEIPDDVFAMSGDSSNTDPGVSSDGSTEDVSKIGIGDGPLTTST